MKLVIKGAFYYDKESDTILVPHFTGEFNIVDCDQYMSLDELKDNYDKSYINDVIDNPIELDGKNYYHAEYSPWSVGEWDLLSDLSELFHLEEDCDF